MSGTYNPVYYAGPPELGGNYATNRCGILGPDTLTSEQEGGNLNFSVPGQVISDVNFYRRVSICAANVTFRNCFFRGSPGDSNAPVNCGSLASNTTFVDCTFSPMQPQYDTPCVKLGASGGTFVRCDFYGGSDGAANSSGSGWTKQWTFTQCAFHDMLYFSPDPGAAGGLPDNASHTDMIQWSGGRLKIDGCGLWAFYDMRQYQAMGDNVVFGTGRPNDNSAAGRYPIHVTGNKYFDILARAGDARTPTATPGHPSIYATSAVQFAPVLRPVAFFEMTRSYVDGSSYPINISSANTFDGPVLITDNKVGTNHRGTAQGANKLLIASKTDVQKFTVTGNTDLKTGKALTLTELHQNAG